MQQMHNAQMLLTAPLDMPMEETEFWCYGLGWFVESFRGHKIVHHGGNINGFSGFTCFVPDLNLGVFVSANMNVPLLADALVQQTVDMALGETDGNWFARLKAYNQAMFDNVVSFFAAFGGQAVAGTKPSHEMAAYAGTYEAPGYRRFRIEEADGKLTADFNTFRVGLRHHHYDTFATEGPIGELPAGLTLTFAANPKGEISTLSVTLGSEKGLQPIVFTK